MRRAVVRQYSENFSRSEGKSVVSPGSACSQAFTSLAGSPAAARHFVALISVVTALDTSQSADPVKAQPREHQTPLTPAASGGSRSEEHTSELQSLRHLVCRLLLDK